MTAIKRKISDGQYLYRLQILKDNYVYVLTWNHYALVIDPGEAKPVSQLLKQENLDLINILATHHHDDHTGGIATLKEETACHVIGPDDDRIPKLDQSVDEGEELTLGPFAIQVLSTPGHTKPHIVYFFRGLDYLFSGDLIFAGGCGRVFEGTPRQMWRSIEKILTLPDHTVVYPGHEYTVKNLEFALFLEPSNEKIQQRLAKAKKAEAEGSLISPSTLAEEKETNPFLKVETSAFQKALRKTATDPVSCFTCLRQLKDAF